MSTAITLDLRCPTGSRSLLSRIVVDKDAPQPPPSVMIQLHCKECSRDFKRLPDGVSIQRVLHHFSIDGVFQSTVIQLRDGSSKSLSLDAHVSVARSASQRRVRTT